MNKQAITMGGAILLWIFLFSIIAVMHSKEKEKKNYEEDGLAILIFSGAITTGITFIVAGLWW